ncbi:hypothetical protein E4656_02180 [Natronospirillum operosum]|uniref:Uncharacterized protein n=1 Tax=Natronospirillum operosum TaxID=2759953 RepID=A0A4Z0WE13_9GAMM|nr:hypothetical protein [Natronospirillum operosum]TGG95250.1 hypothetical protein E4656_02180 [Natronospirillum operosum]
MLPDLFKWTLSVVGVFDGWLSISLSALVVFAFLLVSVLKNHKEVTQLSQFIVYPVNIIRWHRATHFSNYFPERGREEVLRQNFNDLEISKGLWTRKSKKKDVFLFVDYFVSLNVPHITIKRALDSNSVVTSDGSFSLKFNKVDRFLEYLIWVLIAMAMLMSLLVVILVCLYVALSVYFMVPLNLYTIFGAIYVSVTFLVIMYPLSNYLGGVNAAKKLYYVYHGIAMTNRKLLLPIAGGHSFDKPLDELPVDGRKIAISAFCESKN